MAGRLIVVAVLLSLVLGPTLGVAADDLSASAGTRHHVGLRHQVTRGWRTMPGTVEPPSYVPRPAPRQARVEIREPCRRLPLLIRTPFVPPRG
jgi:hypothetical protein